MYGLGPVKPANQYPPPPHLQLATVAVQVINITLSLVLFMYCDHSNKSPTCGTVYYSDLYKMVLTFECVDEILKCDHSHESY